jgi:hypothetical protein
MIPVTKIMLVLLEKRLEPEYIRPLSKHFVQFIDRLAVVLRTYS